MAPAPSTAWREPVALTVETHQDVTVHRQALANGEGSTWTVQLHDVEGTVRGTAGTYRFRASQPDACDEEIRDLVAEFHPLLARAVRIHLDPRGHIRSYDGATDLLRILGLRSLHPGEDSTSQARPFLWFTSPQEGTAISTWTDDWPLDPERYGQGARLVVQHTLKERSERRLHVAQEFRLRPGPPTSARTPVPADVQRITRDVVLDPRDGLPVEIHTRSQSTFHRPARHRELPRVSFQLAREEITSECTWSRVETPAGR